MLVSVEWMRSQLAVDAPSADPFVLADVRWVPGGSGREAYEDGHLPGAVLMDVDADLARPAFDGPGRHPLPAPEGFAETMGRAGICDTDPVIVYDDKGGSIASRLWWMLHVLGHPSALLDLPTLDAWSAAGGDLETGSVKRQPARFTPRPWPADRLADAPAVRAASVSDATVVLDARTGERYRGQVEPFDPVAGHIPGALSADWTENRDPTTGWFRSPAALRDQYRALGVDEGSDAIAYCGSGMTATLAIFAMELAGLGGARLYEGSWSDWVSDTTRPIASGTSPGTMPGEPG